MSQRVQAAGGGTAAAPAAQELRGRPLHLVFGGLMLVMFLAALDQTIVATALPACGLRAAENRSGSTTVCYKA
jgi:hypothetical protein